MRPEHMPEEANQEVENLMSQIDDMSEIASVKKITKFIYG
jgi:hypothetical protein